MIGSKIIFAGMCTTSASYFLALFCSRRALTGKWPAVLYWNKAADIFISTMIIGFATVVAGFAWSVLA